MNRELHELYNRCFPAYQVGLEDFAEIVSPKAAHIIYAYEGGEVAGFALIHGNTITLLCVDEAFRGRGHGNALLEQSEDYIKRSGADRIVLGRGEHCLLQGLPMRNENDTSVTFFRKRNYTATEESENMRLDLTDFDKSKLNIHPKPATVTFRFADYRNETEIAALMAAVRETEPSWEVFYTKNDDTVMLAVEGGDILGMLILEPEGGRFLPTDNVGVIACVGTVPVARRRGIALQMVAEGAQWLKEQGCTAVELLYVALTAWYGRVGFVSTGKQWMGEKIL